MKILGLVILKQKRLKSILQLLKGSKEDLAIAAELLEGKKKIKPPKYRVNIEKDRAFLWYLNKQGYWEIIDSQSYDFTVESNREMVLKNFKKKMETPPFEKIVINY